MKARLGTDGYRLSQRCRKKIEEGIGWMKTVAGLGSQPVGGAVEVAAVAGTGGRGVQPGADAEAEAGVTSRAPPARPDDTHGGTDRRPRKSGGGTAAVFQHPANGPTEDQGTLPRGNRSRVGIAEFGLAV